MIVADAQKQILASVMEPESEIRFIETRPALVKLRPEPDWSA